MKKLGIIVLIFIAIALIGFIFISWHNKSNSNVKKTTDGKIICSDPPCLGQNFPSCTPAELIMSSGGKEVIVSIQGLENEKCHFTMVFDNVIAANCYFKQEDLNDKVLNQMFGNNEGQDAVIAEACK